MIKKSLVKEMVKKYHNKKIGDSALKKVDSLVKEYLRDVVSRASRRSDLSGRGVLKEEDFE